jgi:glycosyltransferase involved in cell wall biosynthesis
MIQKEKPQILHGPMLHGGGFWAMQMAQKFNLPFVAHSRGSDVQLVPEIGYGACLNPVVKKKIQTVLKQADKLIAVSSINKQNMVDLGALPENITVIPNGVHYDEIQAIPFKNIRQSLGLLEDDFVLITVGRNRPVKRMELLFHALRHLKNYKAIKCLCVGPEENLGRLAEKYSVADKVIFTGRVPKTTTLIDTPPYAELINLYRQANVYISTSYVESFGNTAADALACGIPIIVGSKHGIRDIMIENQTGWVMQQETPEELADMILTLYQQREVLSNRSGTIKTSVAQLTWDHIANQTANLYKNMIV